MDPVIFLKMCLLIFQKNVVPAVPFSVISKINPVFTQEILPLNKGNYSNLKHFKKCYGAVGSTILKL